jgi:hypothetical protein
MGKSGFASALTTLTILTLLFTSGSTQTTTPQTILTFFHNKTINPANESFTMSTTNNLADIPDDWQLTYGTGPQIIFLDSTVVRTAGKPSIRIERHVEGIDTNSAREANGIWYNIKPGDHIVAKCWMKTDPSGFGDTNPYSGARIGLDFYGSAGRILGIEGNAYPETDAAQRANYVPWGTSTWTQRTIEITVPATFSADGDLGYPAGSVVVPTSFVMWMQGWSSSYGSTDPAKIWFADAELYITYVPPPVTPPPAQHFHVSFSVGAGGSSDLAAGSYTLLVGQSFAATAYPLANYVPVWTVPGYSPSSEYTFTLAGLADANYAVALTFTYVAPVEPPAPPTPPATSFSVNVGVAAGGTTNVIGVQNVLTTSSLSVTATPNTNYIFSYWLKDNVNAGSTNPIVVTGIASQTITLRPVFTYVPPQPSPVDPTPGTPVAIAGPLDEVFTVLEAVNIPTIDDIFTQLERIVF